MLKKSEEENLVKKPDLMKFEDTDDILTMKPIGWEVVLKEKDTGEEYDFGQYTEKEEAEKVFNNELDKIKNPEKLDEEKSDEIYDEGEEDDEVDGNIETD